MKYTAINIGPIIKTLGMARKPRELWAASYMFSYLMKCIYEEAECKNIKIISPTKPEGKLGKTGLYPDRIYMEGEVEANGILMKATEKFYADLYCEGYRSSNNPDMDYFNLMSVACDAEQESCAIAKLNQLLDVMELCDYAADSDAAQTIYNIISKKKFSSLFHLSTDKDKLPIDDLETIAKVQLSKHKDLKMKSHHKYFCVVQADGDNVGKTVSHKDLKDGQIHTISEALVKFGKKAAELIENFGGLPIYAGGDDLLFIAPVIGEDGRNIFDLVNELETKAFAGVTDAVKACELKDENNNNIEASLSFGISISYYKYPLYEALESARKLLFEKAKQIKQKKAIAWSFRKHSGGTFDAAFSLKENKLQQAFIELIKATTEETVVSAVAHKIREHEALVNVVLESNELSRLDALFDKTLEFQDNDYFKSVKKIMPILFKVIGENDYISLLYSLLRTAKFIKGEDLRDE